MKVKLFSKPNCFYCDKVKNFIKENNIQRIEYDETANVAEVRKYGGMQFPMLLVDDQAIFESEVIIQVLEQLK